MVGTERILEPLRSNPGRTALLCDVDGTLAPIVARPADAAVPRRAREALDALAARYGLVACVSGRRAAEARRIVGLGSLSYFGNHGLETLAPGAREPQLDPAIRPLAERVRRFADEHSTDALERLGVRFEDKDAIRAFHFRGAPDEEAARRALEGIAEAATRQGLHPHWGRKVLEIRPTGAVDKGTAVAAAVVERGIALALFGGDDATDLDAFRRLRELTGSGALEAAVCVGVESTEGPPAIVEDADLVLEGTEGFAALLESLVPERERSTG
jgi:trehalose 6-phosphate phosphatase